MSRWRSEKTSICGCGLPRVGNSQLLPNCWPFATGGSGSLSQTTSVDLALSSSLAAVEHIVHTCPHLIAHEHRELRKSIANRHYEYGSYLLRIGSRAASRHQMFEAVRWGRFDWRVVAKTD